MLLPGLIAWLVLTVTAAAQSATPSFKNYTQPPYKNETVMLAVNQGSTLWLPYYVRPLSSAALTILPRAPGSASGFDGDLYLTGPSTSTTSNITNENIAFISCDTSVYSAGLLTLQNVVVNAINANVLAILFYALDSTTCDATGEYGNYSAVYAMTTVADSKAVSAQLHRAATERDNPIEAMILSRVAFSNVYMTSTDGQAPGTAVAMIILYSITGLITALFLTIIITGAIRAHRHPERYGRRDFLGRPTQSRARGLARAILETIPIVKFGDQPTAKEGTIELERAPETAQRNTDANASRSSTDQTAQTSAGAQEHGVDHGSASTTSPASNHQTTHSASIPAGPTTSTEEDSSLGCSICTDDFEMGQDIRVLPCSHKFHPACVDPWLLDVSSTCPLCRVDLRTNSVAPGGDQAGMALAPPLRSNGGDGSGSRRARLGGFLANLRALQAATPQERIAALRSLRLEGRGPADSAVVGETEALTATAVDAEVDAEQNRQRQPSQSQSQPGRLRTLLGRGERRA